MSELKVEDIDEMRRVHTAKLQEVEELMRRQVYEEQSGRVMEQGNLRANSGGGRRKKELN